MGKALPCLAATAVLGAACSPPEQQLMPLSQGHAWTYEVQGSFDSYVDDVKVTKPVPVGDATGFELAGGMGVSRLGWDGRVLLASELAGTRYEPPLPLITPHATTWEGEVVATGSPSPAEAKTENRPAQEELGGRTYVATLSTVTIKTRGKTIRVTTWFVPGIGVLKQEQTTNDQRDRTVRYLSGP